tara:strand:+ start:490 stop:1194 length:705 start_codon:yes stop_codon:yes gene_type:complete
MTKYHIDKDKVGEFWRNHSAKFQLNENSGLSNLEMDEELGQLKLKEERRVINQYFKNLNGCMLDLGAGSGEWSFFLAKQFSKVIAVEKTEGMIEVFNKKLVSSKSKNIELIESDVTSLDIPEDVDVVFMSGLCIYINDLDLEKLLSDLVSNCKSQLEIIVRDGTALTKRHFIDGEYSEALDASYYALYRTREEYIRLFRDQGFYLKKDQDMFEEGSKLNKWKETRLRIYKFIKE